MPAIMSTRAIKRKVRSVSNIKKITRAMQMVSAAKLRRPVCFMAGIYLGGNRYHIVFEPIADFSGIEADGEARAVHDALQRYVAAVERHCPKYPYNWFNFFDFWGTRP